MGGAWLGAAVLWLLPPNNGANMFHDVFPGAPSGAGWLSGLQSSAANAVAGSGTAIAIALAIGSAAIGLCVLTLRGARIAVYAAIAISLVFWFLAEGLGGVFSGQATVVGSGPLMILVAAQLLALAPRRDPRRSNSSARSGVTRLLRTTTLGTEHRPRRPAEQLLSRPQRRAGSSASRGRALDR